MHKLQPKHSRIWISTWRSLAAFRPTLFLKLASILGRPASRFPGFSKDPYIAVDCHNLLYFSLSLRAVTGHRFNFENDRRVKPSSDGMELVYFLLIFSKSAWRPLSSSGLDMLYVKDSISFREILIACWYRLIDVNSDGYYKVIRCINNNVTSWLVSAYLFCW